MLLNRQIAGTPPPPTERVLQVGEGNFIRAFTDWLLQGLNQQTGFTGSVVLTPARAQGKPKIESLQAQDGLFTVWLRGLQEGEAFDETEIISVISRIVNPFDDWDAFLALAQEQSIDIVVSNTTEMGLTYTPTPYPSSTAPASYPARLTAYLQRRFDYFGDSPESGMVVLPAELLENNGDVLRDIVLHHAEDWDLGGHFVEWVRSRVIFANTLVDRIVPGFPADAETAWQRLGYEDRQLSVAEPFHLWAIEAHEEVMRRLPFHETALNVQYTDNLFPFRTQKIRVLNGSHTFMAPLGLYLGLDTVRDAVTHPTFGPLIRAVIEDLIVPYSEMDAQVLREYSGTVLERYLNPFIAHHLRDITLNTLSKFRIRLVPVLRRHHDVNGSVPEPFALGLASQILLYKPGSIGVTDTPEVLEKLANYWQAGGDTTEISERILRDVALWGEDLSILNGFAEQVAEAIDQIEAGKLAERVAALVVV